MSSGMEMNTPPSATLPATETAACQSFIDSGSWRWNSF